MNKDIVSRLIALNNQADDVFNKHKTEIHKDKQVFEAMAKAMEGLHDALYYAEHSYEPQEKVDSLVSDTEIRIATGFERAKYNRGDK